MVMSYKYPKKHKNIPFNPEKGSSGAGAGGITTVPIFRIHFCHMPIHVDNTDRQGYFFITEVIKHFEIGAFCVWVEPAPPVAKCIYRQEGSIAAKLIKSLQSFRRIFKTYKPVCQDLDTKMLPTDLLLRAPDFIFINRICSEPVLNRYATGDAPHAKSPVAC